LQLDTGALDPELARLISRLPKVELHVHLEGTLEPELAFRLAVRNGLPLPYRTVAEMRAAYDFADLQSFLDIYYAACSVLVTRQDFRDLTLAYLAQANADGVRHVEPFFDPQTHTERGIPMADVIGGILDGLDEGGAEYGITSGLILSFLRHLPADSADAALAAAEPWLDRIVAVGLDSSEIGFPPEPFLEKVLCPQDLGLLIASGSERHNNVVKYLGNCITVPFQPLAALPVGRYNTASGLSVLLLEPRKKSGPEIEAHYTVVVVNINNRAALIQKARIGIRPITFGVNPFVPIMIRRCRGLGLDTVYPGIFPRRLIKMPMNDSVFF